MEVSRFPLFLSTAISSLLSFLDARIRERTGRIFCGLLLAQDKRRTASKWFRAAVIGVEFKSAYKHVAAVGRKAALLSTRVLRMVQDHAAGTGDKIVVALDDTLTKRYGPEVEGAGFHHNATTATPSSRCSRTSRKSGGPASNSCATSTPTSGPST